MSLRKAIAWTSFWILIAFIVAGVFYFYRGPDKAMQFMAGYIIEESLSVDNLFVFLIIFSFFKINPVQQRFVLNYGIIGVILLRGLMIFLGIILVTRFYWILYLFGIFLVYSGYKIFFGSEIDVHPEKNAVMLYFKNLFPVMDRYEGNKFFIKDGNQWFATSLFIVLVVIETTDVMFAVDSIPAVFGITTDPTIVFSSNLLAVAGLRSIYFILERIHNIFEYVKYGVGIVLVFVGLKMIIDHLFPIGIFISLSIVIGIISISIILSIIKKRFQ